MEGRALELATQALKGLRYRKDGPPLAVDFDVLPPDAFNGHLDGKGRKERRMQVDHGDR